MRAIPDDNLAYPVLVTGNTGTIGSGFYLNTTRGVFLVTARHVIYMNNSTTLISQSVTLTSNSGLPDDHSQNILELDLLAMEKSSFIHAHASKDVAIVRVGAIEPGEPHSPAAKPLVSLVPGVVMRSTAQGGIVGVKDTQTIKFYDDVLVSNETIIFGYPVSLGLKSFPNAQPQFDPSRPLLRSGVVAGKYTALKTIILDCPVYPGNSGGPVLEIEEHGLEKRLRVIGVVSEYIPFELQSVVLGGLPGIAVGNSGYSVATPMDFVIELVNLA